MRRLHFLKLTGFSALILILPLLSCVQRAKSPPTPNFIILFCDDLGYGDLSCYGHPTIKTPNIDQMAREGMKFTQFYVGASLCTPSRAALLTGRYPIRSGMCSNKRGVLFPDSDGGLPQDEITIARALKEKGYKTACIGKWHLGHLPPYLPTNHGFDYYFGIPYSNDMSPAQNDGEGAGHFPPIPLLENEKTIKLEPDQSLLTKQYTEKAISFINQHMNDPFFLYLPYTFPHTPLYASETFKGKSKRGLYGDTVQEIDWSVGEILNTLKRKNLDKNTFVFFTSDNGPWLLRKNDGGSAGLLRAGKGTTWEGGMREPAIAWWPGEIARSTICNALCCTMDLFTTILTLANIPIPDDRTIDGVNILPLLNQEKASVRNVFFYYAGANLYAARKGPWKAHFWSIENEFSSDRKDIKHDPPLLFNIENDPSERFDISNKYPEIIEEIKEEVRFHQENLHPKPSQLERILK